MVITALVCLEFVLARVLLAAEVAVEGGSRGFCGGGGCGGEGARAGWHCGLCPDSGFDGEMRGEMRESRYSTTEYIKTRMKKRGEGAADHACSVVNAGR